ncbi:MAG: hypothetical protein LBN20_05170, partial [Endomicrobium sp.]|nr:hypothetical protein [Endomicrobium sp.]
MAAQTEKKDETKKKKKPAVSDETKIAYKGVAPVSKRAPITKKAPQKRKETESNTDYSSKAPKTKTAKNKPPTNKIKKPINSQEEQKTQGIPIGQKTPEQKKNHPTSQHPIHQPNKTHINKKDNTPKQSESQKNGQQIKKNVNKTESSQENQSKNTAKTQTSSKTDDKPIAPPALVIREKIEVNELINVRTLAEKMNKKAGEVLM